MTRLTHWLSSHKFQSYLLVFFLLSLPPVGLYFAAHALAWVIPLLALVVLGNILTVLIP